MGWFRNQYNKLFNPGEYYFPRTGWFPVTIYIDNNTTKLLEVKNSNRMIRDARNRVIECLSDQLSDGLRKMDFSGKQSVLWFKTHKDFTTDNL